jgi:hypothetical protein
MTDYFGRGDASAQFKSLLLSSRFDQISLEKTFFDAPNPALDED